MKTSATFLRIHLRCIRMPKWRLASLIAVCQASRETGSLCRNNVLSPTKQTNAKAALTLFRFFRKYRCASPLTYKTEAGPECGGQVNRISQEASDRSGAHRQDPASRQYRDV